MSVSEDIFNRGICLLLKYPSTRLGGLAERYIGAYIRLPIGVRNAIKL